MAFKHIITASRGASGAPITFKHPLTKAALPSAPVPGQPNFDGAEVVLDVPLDSPFPFECVQNGETLVLPTVLKYPVIEVPTAPLSVTFPFPVSSSLGVYVSSTGEKVSKVWDGIEKPAGTLSLANAWDGKDDAGAIVELLPSQLEYRLSYRDASKKPVWEGVVGNTSDSFTANVWRSLVVMYDLAISPNGKLFATLNYNEGIAGLMYSPPGTFQAPRAVKPAHQQDAFSKARATDKYLYAATNNSGWDNNQSCFVVRFDAVTGAQVPWPQGTTLSTSGNAQTYTGVLSARQTANVITQMPGESTEAYEQRFFDAWLLNRVTGVAITASYIAVAHQGQNVVEVFDITSGALLGTLPTPSPGNVAFATNGDLWVITGTQVKRFGYDGANSFTEKLTLSGLTTPIALDAHPNLDVVLVADYATHNTKAFNGAGVLQWIHLQAGGYPALGPAASTDKAWFEIQDQLSHGAKDRDRYGSPYTFVKWAPDGTFWILDTAHKRALRYSADRVFLEHIMYLPDQLFIAGDQNDGTCIVSNNMEFKVSLGPLKPGDQTKLPAAERTWEFVRSWNAGLDRSRYGELINIATLSNGRRYGQVPEKTNKGKTMWLCELPADGSPLYVFADGEAPNYGDGNYSMDLQGDGVLRGWAFNFNTKTFRVREQAITGFVTQGKYERPVRGPITFGSQDINTTFGAGTQPYPNKTQIGQMRAQKLLTGDFVTYKARKEGLPSFHLGVIPAVGTTWKSQFYPEYNAASPNPQGTYSNENAFGGYDGANSFVVGNRISVLFNSQNAGSGCTFDDFDEDGLLGNRYGLQNRFSGFDGTNAPAGLAGNCVDMYAVRASATSNHVYTVDEAVHAGLHRWRVPTEFTKVTIPLVPAKGTDVRVAPDPATGPPNGVNWQDPIVLLTEMRDADGVIRPKGHYRSTNAGTPAITLNCGSTPVDLSQMLIAHAGRGVSGGTGANLRVRDVTTYGLNTTVDNQTRGRAFQISKGTNVDLQYVTMETGGGIYVEEWLGNHTPAQTVKIQNIKSRDIIGSNGKGTDGAGGYRSIVQLKDVRTKGMRLAWIEGFNRPDKSRIEDTYNFFRSGGLDADNPLLGYALMGYGSYPFPATDTLYTGAVFSADGGYDSSKGEMPPAFILLDELYGISNCNAAGNIAVGHDITYRNIRAVTSGYLADGRQLRSTFKAFSINNFYAQAPGYNNTISGITSLFYRTKDVYRRADFVADPNYDPTPDPGIDVAHATLLLDVTSPADGLEREADEWRRWVTFLNKNNQTCGSRYKPLAS